MNLVSAKWVINSNRLFPNNIPILYIIRLQRRRKKREGKKEEGELFSCYYDSGDFKTTSISESLMKMYVNSLNEIFFPTVSKKCVSFNTPKFG